MNEWRFAVGEVDYQNSIGFHYVTPVEEVHPSGHRGFQGLNAPVSIQVQSTQRQQRELAYCSTRWQSTGLLVETSGLPVSLALKQPPTMSVPRSKNQAASVNQRGALSARKDSGDRTRPAGKRVRCCASSAWCQYRVCCS